DRRHNLAFSYIFQRPSLGATHFNANRLASGVLDHWQLSGITHYVSGPPLRIDDSGGVGCRVDPREPAGSPAQTLCDSNHFTGDARTWLGVDNNDIHLTPQLVFNPQWGAQFKGVSTPWLNPFAVTLPNIGQFGTYEQPTFRGPASNNWDMTLFKSFSLGEQRRIEFRWAAFNIFNRGQLLNPITSAAFVWQLPLGATDLKQGHAELTNFGPGGFGYINDKTGHREMEAAIKIYF